MVLLLTCVGGWLAACEDGNRMLATTAQPTHAARPHVQGVTLDARQAPDDSTLLRLRDLGVTHITLTSFGFQPEPGVPEIRHDPDVRWYSESDRGIRALARKADSLGMQVVLKPHIWVRGNSGESGPHAIRFQTEAEWQQWEKHYRAFILHYARLSEEIGAPLFVIGTELAGSTRTRTDFWRGLIRDVRQVYSGKLTYAANWYDEYEHIRFWSELDFIGVQAYFPISTAENPTPEALRAGWIPHRRHLLEISRRASRPILFTEIGYRSVPGAAAEPWRWPTRDEVGAIHPDDSLQATLYQAFFESLWQEPAFAGAILWKFYPYRTDRPERWMLDFTPQNKAAEHVIGRWFRQKSGDR